MAYRKREKGSKKFNERLERARQTRLRNRLDLPERDYPVELPELRRKIIVETYDFGETVRHEILLYRTNRIDSYRVCIDGTFLPNPIGWSRVLELTRKAFVRVNANYQNENS